MADADSTIFNKKASERLRSPDDLEKYVRVTNPSVWMVLGACVALLAGMLAWGVFGSVTTSVSAMGAIIEVEGEGGTDTAPVCFLGVDKVGQVRAGNSAVIGGNAFEVASVSDAPLSKAEVARAFPNDYLADSLMKEDWAYLVTFEGDMADLKRNVALPVVITVERMAPISLILKGKG